MTSPYGTSVLKRAIERGLANARMEEELDQLGELVIASRAEAEAVCWGLEQLGTATRDLGKATHALALLLQHVKDGDCEAAGVFQERGIPQLLRLFEEIQGLGTEDASTLLFILKLGAMYGTTEAALKIIESARQPLKPDSYMWSIILGAFQAGHPQNELVFGSLKEPLPPDFIRVALLDAANAALIAGETMDHPFDSEEGIVQLRTWLENTDPEEHSYARSATAALPFISRADQVTLLGLAMKHPALDVRVEAAWAASKLGRKEGLHRLVEHCLNVKTAEVAKRYLTELGQQEIIPAEANEPGFAALAEFAQWCAHPNELGRVPDELEIVDHRQLRWPPERKSKPFWLIRYRLKDATGLEDDEEDCGLVGSITFCLFSYKLAQRPPEDAYAVHCYWEMEQSGLIAESDLSEDPDDSYSNLLEQWQGPPLEDARMCIVADLSPELGYPQRLVGLASARLKGEEGWVVLDGHRSAWYPCAEQPADSPAHVALKVHVGRNLLGFVDRPDRAKYLAPIQTRTPEQIIAAYEKILAEATQASGGKQADYFRVLGPLAIHFDSYLQALMGAERHSQVRKVVELLAPHWQHASGFATLGRAAYWAGHLDLAEPLLIKYRDACANYERGEEISLLAEVWCRTGKRELARELLLDCLGRLVADSNTTKGTDKKFLENQFQRLRSAFQRLFPKQSEAALLDRHIPPSTLRSPQ